MSQPLFHALFDESERRPLTVSQLTENLRKAIESRFSSVWVEGEISNFKPHSSGHWYFTLKDESAQLRAKCFRSANTRIRFKPRDGLHVRARGRLSVYAPRGDYELIVEVLDPVGAGALRVAFEQLRDRLQAEGLFAPEVKRKLPILPRRVGIVTSPTGAAIRDILNVLSRRTRTVHVLFSPARVQGEGAGRDIARAIRLVNEHHQRAVHENRPADLVDVLIVGRGGGSTEDLWAFNEEEVARAIRSSVIPVISAVGHETDFTIADFVADKRAPTPSAAAELVATQEDHICNSLDRLGQQLMRLIRYKVVAGRNQVQEHALSQVFEEVRSKMRSAHGRADAATYELNRLISRKVTGARGHMDALQQKLSPAELQLRVSSARTRFSAAEARSSPALQMHLGNARQRLGLAVGALQALSPLAVLQRGYAIAETSEGELLRDSRKVEVGDAVSIRLAQGRLATRVEDVEE